ncbi:hypothetical protein EHQ12_01725 [Leptospira gomenensis]|uniref:Uncharacterized protein n=1 Tax=Leptospira gomenensis TaxID=2484974 RepID=A0A5F1YDN7_9LEPT|nr:hypothetical protein [Leptospira gomenensis]TGK36389.1 hypothetical protein EHQ17_04380 [Leptospira gomenensis]TGK43405.1 hypothetical protein EHQ07_12625 [Leptospira gomenensis]TGK44408.1 hypothetical protein EHQ12_01725 [Leptospira gomenensis]TGK67532.1 hypothetical protein EHQ13_01915 [Leptospira gomenensis]
MRQPEPGYILLEAEGSDPFDAEKNAKLEMIRQTLGTRVESNSYVMDSASLGELVETSESGIIRRFRILEQKYYNNRIFIKSEGVVDPVRFGESIEEQYRLLGKPRILLLVTERFGSEQSPFGRSLTETKLISLFPHLDFVEPSLSYRQIQSMIGSVKNGNVPVRILEPARNEGADLVWWIEFDSREGDRLSPDASLRGVFATLAFRLIEVSSGKILGSGNLQGGKPAIDLRYGSEKAVDQLLSEMKPSVLKQLSEKWKRGNSLRVVLEDSRKEVFREKLFGLIRTTRGVASVRDLGRDERGRSVFEVEALMNARKLYSILLETETRADLSLEAEEIRGSFILLRLKK